MAAVALIVGQVSALSARKADILECVDDHMIRSMLGIDYESKQIFSPSGGAWCDDCRAIIDDADVLWRDDLGGAPELRVMTLDRMSLKLTGERVGRADRIWRGSVYWQCNPASRSSI